MNRERPRRMADVLVVVRYSGILVSEPRRRFAASDKNMPYLCKYPGTLFSDICIVSN